LRRASRAPLTVGGLLALCCCIGIGAFVFVKIKAKTPPASAAGGQVQGGVTLSAPESKI